MAQASLEFSGGLKVTGEKPEITKYFNNAGTPYTSVAQVKAETVGVRHQGLTVNVAGVEYWFKDGILDAHLVEKTGVSSTGSDGHTPYIQAGYWWINGVTTGVKAVGSNGDDGVTPTIGVNGNWYIGAVDTGVKAAGTNGGTGDSIQLQKSATAIQWKPTLSPTWTDLVLLTDLKGADGKNIEIQNNGTYIQWRTVGGTWANLIALSALVGAPGYTPQKNTDYFDGDDGDDGRGIASTAITYAVSASGTTTPTTWSSSIPTAVAGQFFWTKTVITYTDATTTTSYVVAKSGVDGIGTNGSTPTLGVGTVTTGAAGSSVSVTAAGTALARLFNFIIPKGDKGDDGIGTNATVAALIEAAVDQGTDTPADTDDLILGKGTTFKKWSWPNFIAKLSTIFAAYSQRNKLDTTVEVNNAVDAIAPNFENDIYRVTLDSTGVLPIAIMNFSNLPAFGRCCLLKVLNSRTTSATITFRTTNLTQGDITYTFYNFSATTLNIPAGKRAEISYLFDFTTATTCMVHVIYTIQP